LLYKLIAFEKNIKTKERYFERGLMERFSLYNKLLTTKSTMKIVRPRDIDAVFKRDLPRNDFEASQMINNLIGVVDKETLVGQLSFVRDAKETVALAAEEDEVNDNGFNNKNYGKDSDETREPTNNASDDSEE
jgi:SPP1 family phage portal protein